MESIAAYSVSLGITACGIWVVAGSIAEGSSLAWIIAGLAAVTIGSLSFFDQFKPAN
jgi:hypothetical protein